MNVVGVSINRSESDNHGRYEARVADSNEAAELTYSRMNAGTIIADHTFVPVSLRGRGIASALVERLVADARDGDYRVVPVCPFVKARFAEHPEWSDVQGKLPRNPD